MKEIVLLSEIHPLGTRWFNSFDQACKWFNLFTISEIEWFQEKRKISFEEIIGFINKKCAEKNRSLIIRDWSFLDFTAVPYLKNPSYRLSTADWLRSKFTVINTATVRHPIDQWLSLKYGTFPRKITLEEFLKGYLRFAEYCKQIGYIRYEDFTKSPEKEIERLCKRLSINYDPTFIKNWWQYTTITGDTNSQRGYRREIKPMPRRKMGEGLLKQFEQNPDYKKSIEILGYDHL